MPNNAPLTIENFDFEKLGAKTFESKKSRVFFYFSIHIHTETRGDVLINFFSV